MLRIRVRNSLEAYKLDIISFTNDDDRSYFFLESSEDDNINLTIPYILDAKLDFEISNFKCTPFISSLYYKEENIFEVHVETDNFGRIGWIFPVQSLSSIDHSNSGNVHFLKYAFVAFQKLLSGDFFEEDITITVSDLSSELLITDIYPSSLLVLTLSEEKTSLIIDFEITNYLHSLFKYKYFLCQELNELGDIEKDSYDTTPSKIKISPLAKELRSEIFISSLYKNHLKARNHPLVQFHLLYQIIELLINRVYDCEIKVLINGSSTTAKTPHEIGLEVKSITSEEYRIKKMLETYFPKPITYRKDLITSCNLMLKEFNKEKMTVAEAFYQVRNIIVHDFRKVTDVDNNYNLLKSINKEFELLLSELLSNYKEPFNDPEDNKKLSTAWLMYKILTE